MSSDDARRPLELCREYVAAICWRATEVLKPRGYRPALLASA
jgi:hypothetical protein